MVKDARIFIIAPPIRDHENEPTEKMHMVGCVGISHYFAIPIKLKNGCSE